MEKTTKELILHTTNNDPKVKLKNISFLGMTKTYFLKGHFNIFLSSRPYSKKNYESRHYPSKVDFFE